MPHLNGSAAGAGTALVELHGGAVGRTTRDDRPRPASRFCLAGKEGERCWARDARTSQQRQGQERSRARYQRTWLSCGFRRSAWQPTRQQRASGQISFRCRVHTRRTLCEAAEHPGRVRDAVQAPTIARKKAARL